MVSLLNFFAYLFRGRISSFRSLYCLSLCITSSIRCPTFSMMFRSVLHPSQVKTAILFYYMSPTLFCSVDTRIVLLPNAFVLAKLSVTPHDKSCLQVINMFQAVIFTFKNLYHKITKAGDSTLNDDTATTHFTVLSMRCEEAITSMFDV